MNGCVCGASRTNSCSTVRTDEIFDDIHKIAKLIKDGASSSDIQKVRNDMQPLIEGKLKDIGNIIKAAGETVGLLRNSDEVIKRNRAGILGVRGNLPLRDADPGMGILVVRPALGYRRGIISDNVSWQSQIDRLVALMDTSAPEMEMAEGECGKMFHLAECIDSMHAQASLERSRTISRILQSF